MENNFFIKELGFNHLKNKLPTEIEGKIEGVDRVHYSGNLPAVFFKEVKNFEPNTLKEIAKLQKQIWNNSSVVFLYVTSLAEIRIYNCNEKPVFSKDNQELQQNLDKKLIESCTKNDKEKLKKIHHIFSAIAVDSGSIWTSEADYAKKIKLQTKVDTYLVKSLIELAEKLTKSIENEEIIHSLLMRSIFIMYLQDRNAIPQVIWDEVGNNDFLNILDDHSKTYKLFEIISNNFNGNAFPLIENEKNTVLKEHLEHLKHCLTDGDIKTEQQKLFDDWRLFDFSLIRIEMLSEIYENFLEKFNPDKQRKTGTYYTPPSLVELVLNNILPENENEYNKKILDPACGSGIFLAMAYKRIVNRWKRATNKEPDFTTLSKLLTDNIYGVEIDKKSIKVAAFSLYLSMLDLLDPKDVWLDDDKMFPYLIYDEESNHPDDKKGSNLFRTDTIKENGKFEKIKYDLIIGNPPFGTTELEKNIQKYCSDHSFDKQYVIPFIHKSAGLANNGKVALLFNTKILTNNKATAQNFRKWLFNSNYVEKIYNLSILRKAPKNFGGQLFSSATVPVSIVFFQKELPEKGENTIEYWAPTTFIKNHIAEGVVVDSTDIKYLPRKICQEAESKIWKIAQWGTMGDYYLIQKFLRKNSITEIVHPDNNGVGFQLIDSTTKKPIANKFLKEMPFILPEEIECYKTPIEQTNDINNCIKTKASKEYYEKYYGQDDLPMIDVFRRIGKQNTFKSPHILIKEGLKRNKICASYFDYDCSFNSKVFGIHHQDSSLLKALTCYINSSISSYFLFMHSASWGIEREEIKPNDIKQLPLIPNTIIEALNKHLDNIETTVFSDNQNYSIINLIDELIFESFDLTVKEKTLIKDFILFKHDLFFKGQNSIALHPIAPQKPETIPYAKMLCNEINDFLKIGDFKVNARVYNVSPYTSLCMVVLQFVDKNKVTTPALIESDNEFQKDLKKVDEFTLSKYAQNIYIRKQVRYSDDDTIYLVKPNQKRFWTRSQAIDDANTIINEISAINDGE
jgi:type I restriction-modification system DNA methylase subunit